uniref:Ent-kaurene oxidase 1 n=1 Tax=Lygodium japonicum TaxID=13824 RepID=A0A0B6VJC5_LYGJA|nr:ent-kaurene oxidase 1 [Lygodium japonicum]
MLLCDSGNMEPINAMASRLLITDQIMPALRHWWPINPVNAPASIALSSLIAIIIFSQFYLAIAARRWKRHFPPAVPGLPLLGNLLQLGEKKPHKTFTAWAKKYGPIYTIKTGADTMVVISSAELAKEAMITKFSSISTRKTSRALSILTEQKTMVAMSDYGEEHRMLKKLVVTNLLGPIPQKANRHLREMASFKMLDAMYSQLKEMDPISCTATLNLRDYIKQALFPFSMYQVLGRDPEYVYVKEFGRNVGRWEMFEIFVGDPLKAVIEVDWRDFFPALQWIPNKAVEDKITSVAVRRKAVIRALIEEQRQMLAKGKQPDCYLDFLLTQATHLTPKQLEMSAWEPIIESADTTLVTIEWAMYEIANNPAVQERLYQEINEVVGSSRIVTEEDVPKLKYLDAIVKETLRKYPPVPLLPPRHVDEDVQLGGFDLKKGWQIIFNIYGINYNTQVWKNPEVWDPDRVLGDKDLDLGFKDHRVLPFGTGKRMCAGVTQAMYIIPTNIAYYVQHFQWALPQDNQDGKGVADTVFLTTHKLHPLQAIVTPRHSARLPLTI